MSAWTTLLAMAAVVVVTVAGNYPTFEGAAEFRDSLMVPAGAPVGSLIYRLRASDHDKDYPLYFQATDFGSYVIKIENLPCPPNTTAGCQADVYLDRVLIPGQTFQFRITVRDTRGDTTTVPVRLVATEARSDVETIFPHIPAIIIVPEDVKVNTELEYVIVKKNTESRKSASIELRGSPELTIGGLRMNKDTTTGTISVSRPLDFETRNMYRLQVVALDMYVEIGKDSRNAAAFEVIVVVEDVQDTPPIFTRLETIVHLHNNMSIGDVVTKVEAIDGDRGRPRRIKYGLVSENRPFTVLFEIGLFSGEVKLKRSMSEVTKITGGKQPAILTVMADEEVTGTGEPPAMSTLADVVLILDDVVDRPPYFHNKNYACHLNENSGQGTTLAFTDGYVMQVHDDSMGKESVYALTLENNNGTFEVTPAVIDRHGRFTIMVRNNHLLDFESSRSVRFEVLATELSVSGGDANRTRTSARASVVVYLDDVNDNAPRFTSAEYDVQLPENATAGVRVTTVEAVDSDTGPFGSVRYTAVLGYKNSSLVLDPITGVIVVSNDNHGFDREESAEYRLTVEARDMDGSGLATTVPLIIHVLDINDETPVFQDTPIQFVLTQDMRNFTERAFIKAIDNDAEAPNNVVRYEIINGNYNNRFTLNPETGELFISSDLYDSSRTRRDSTNSAFVVLTVRAYDLGVPHRSSTTQVRIYPPSSGARQMTFLIPASMDVAAVHNLLERLTGGKVTINSIKPNYEHVQRPAANTEKNIVTATVAYNTNTVIDVEEFRKHLAQCSNEVQMAQVDNRNDKNLSFWLNLLLLLAILLAALSLLFCCCYQQYLRCIHNKLHRHDRTKNKGIQAPSPNSSESTEIDPRQKVYILSEKPVTPIRIAKRTRTKVIPNLVKKKASAESLLIEDVGGNEYRIIDKRRSWSDETTDTRQEMFFKQGNAEILRIMSNDSLEVMDSASNVGGFNVFDELAGKKVIMNKFLNSQPDEIVVDDQYNESVKGNVEKTQFEEVKKEDIDEEQKKMTAFQRDVLLTKFLAEEQQKLMTRLETRSLPGANMATQTEMHAGTQTTRSCLRVNGGGGGDGGVGSRRSRSYELQQRSPNGPSNIVDNRNDKNLSFWLNLLLLLAILLAALSLLFCCCYQQYLRCIHNKLHRHDRTKNKGIQAPSPNSSESTEIDPRQKVYILSEKPVTPIRIAKRTRTKVIPNLVKKKASAESLLIEDVGGNEYRIIDKRRSWSDETTDTRQEMFFKQGNAEILRIMSNDSLEVMDSASNVGGFNVFDELAGKKVIMNKFLNSQPDEIVVDDQYNESVKGNVEKTQFEEVKKEDIDEEQKKMTAFQRDVLLTKFLAEEQQKLMTRLETRSLPGANMATQTEMHAGTQTTRSCLRVNGGGGGDGGVGSRRSRSYDDRECSRSAHCPRRSTSMPRRQLFNSPIMEETGSGSGASSGLRSSLAGRGATGTGSGSVMGGSGSVAGGSGVGAKTAPGRRRLFATSSASSLSADVADADKRKSRSYSSIRELDLDRQLQYMTPSLRSRALARRRLSTSLPPHGCRAPYRSAQMLEKKSVFTIAYGDVATQKINCSADSSSNNWE